MTASSERYRRIAGELTRRVEAVASVAWDAPAPREGWSARDVEPMDGAMRASGHYGPRVAVEADADDQTKLLAFLGRHP